MRTSTNNPPKYQPVPGNLAASQGSDITQQSLIFGKNNVKSSTATITGRQKRETGDFTHTAIKNSQLGDSVATNEMVLKFDGDYKG